MTLQEQLLLHEGFRLKPYKDTVGKISIGVGRNLTDKGLTKVEVLILLSHDIAEATRACEDAFPWFGTLTEARQRVLIDMAFNLGIHGLKGFKGMLGAVAEERYDDAAAHMLDSKWATQVGHRATRLARWMREGVEA